MKRVPTDGSYYDHHQGCVHTSGACGKGLVRRLNLDRSIEGATVSMCRFHWDKEMKHRQWQNDQGVAEPWDVFDFFESNPALDVVYKAKEDDEKEIKPYYPIINYVPKLEKSTQRDVFITFMNMSDVLVSMRYMHKVGANKIGDAIRDTRKHMMTTRRMFGLISVFENAEEPNKLSQQRELCDSVYDAIHMYGRGVLKYA